MNSIKLEINLNDIVEDMFADAHFDRDLGSSPSSSFSEAVRNEIVSQVSRQLKSQISDSAIDLACGLAKQKADEFIDNELGGIVHRKLRSGQIKTRFDGFKSFDELVDQRISKFDIDDLIKKHIDLKTAQFAKEMKVRYDNVFAAKVVQGLAEQKMLNPDIAKMLLGSD